MNQPDARTAAEHDLHVIRSLMERATVYRAISAPTALIGGVLALVSAIFIYLCETSEHFLGRAVRPREFGFIWLDVLFLTAVTNTVLIWRQAKRSGRPFVSPGMKLALSAIGPNLIVPAAFTVWFLKVGFLGAVELELVVVWVVFYGLALLSTAMFAPRSLILLGWAFLISGVAVPVLANALEALPGSTPNLIMGITFGLYHVIYAVCTWSSARPEPEPQPVDE